MREFRVCVGVVLQAMWSTCTCFHPLPPPSPLYKTDMIVRVLILIFSNIFIIYLYLRQNGSSSTSHGSVRTYYVAAARSHSVHAVVCAAAAPEASGHGNDDDAADPASPARAGVQLGVCLDSL